MIDDLEKDAAAMVVAFASIDKSKLDQGTVSCPICGGTLQFVRVGPKRHVRATCETLGCLRFMS